MSNDDWVLPVDPDTLFNLLECTGSISEFICLMCTVIDKWADIRGIDKTMLAEAIARLIKEGPKE